MAARKRSRSVGRSRGSNPRRQTRVLGLGTGASALLALGLSPLAAAPAAHADDFGLDSILDPIINSLSIAHPALSVGLDHWAASLDATLGSLAGADPTTGLDHWVTSLDAAWGSFSSTDPTTGLESPLAAASSIDTISSLSSADPTTGLDSTVDTTSATTPFAEFMNNLQQEWINSNFGSHVDNVLNSWYLDHAHSAAAADSCGMICNGANGTAADPNGQDGGTMFGNGGAGYTYTEATNPDPGHSIDGGNGGDALRY
ncbi:MAG: hypothetical protein WAO18_24210, partial [Mycobacterium sp.]